MGLDPLWVAAPGDLGKPLDKMGVSAGRIRPFFWICSVVVVPITMALGHLERPLSSPLQPGESILLSGGLVPGGSTEVPLALLPQVALGSSTGGTRRGQQSGRDRQGGSHCPQLQKSPFKLPSLSTQSRTAPACLVPCIVSSRWLQSPSAAGVGPGGGSWDRPGMCGASLVPWERVPMRGDRSGDTWQYGRVPACMR